MTNDDALVEAMARAMWKQVGLRDPDLDTMRECAQVALAAYRQHSDDTRAAFERECG